MLHNPTQSFAFQRAIILKEIHTQVHTYTQNIYTYGKDLNILMLPRKREKNLQREEKDQGLCAVS